MFLFQILKRAAAKSSNHFQEESKLKTINASEKALYSPEEIEKSMCGNWYMGRVMRGMRDGGFTSSFFVELDIQKEQEFVERLFTKDYLGDTLYTHSQTTRTTLMTLKPIFSRYLEGGFGPSTVAGRYLTGTNVILLREPESSPFNPFKSLWRLAFQVEDFEFEGKKYSEKELELIHILCHEFHHRFSYKRGEDQFFSYDASYGSQNYYSASNWFNEGLTEFFALRLLVSSGIPVEGECEPYLSETSAIHLISQLVSPDILKQAYFSGDLNQVMKTVDSKLGNGSFEELLYQPGSAEAIDYLEDKMDSMEIAFVPWDETANNLGPKEQIPKR